MSINATTAGIQERDEGQATYGMANLRSEKTGLPFVVFISQRDEARHAARVKVSRGPKVMASEMSSYAISPFEHKAGERLSSREEELLRRWTALNREVLRGYWNGMIEYTEDAIAQIKSV